MSKDTFSFNGTQVTIKAGQSIAAALTDAGHRVFRHTAKDADRGIFCGMGVCQECLVTIDGTPNKRACMSSATPGLKVLAQAAFVSLGTATPARAAGAPLTLEPEVLVIGGGAGGLSAAISARQAGAQVVILDERKIPGGQFFKQSATGGPLDAQQSEGAALLVKAQDLGVEILDNVEVWGAFDGPLYLAEQNGRAVIARPKAAIVATGAYERPCMVPGWTLPGVITTGAAQTLWRSYRTLPGNRVAICGSGPLNVQVALELARGGAELAMVSEAAPSPFSRPVPAVRAALAGPKLTLKGLAMLWSLRRRGIAVRNQTELVSIEKVGEALRATFRDSSGKEFIEIVDAVCMNQGFEPQNEILRLLGAEMKYDPAFGHLRCQRSESFETSVPGLFAVGDCAGLGGAPAAMIEGRIAGRAAAAKVGHTSARTDHADKRSLHRHRKFQAYLWQLHDVSPRNLANAPDSLLICRCEEITLGQIKDGLGKDSGHLGTIKRATRVGMGRCQGRYCGPAAVRLVSEATGKTVDDKSFFAPRVPIKPVSIAAILATQEALDDAS